MKSYKCRVCGSGDEKHDPCRPDFNQQNGTVRCGGNTPKGTPCQNRVKWKDKNDPEVWPWWDEDGMPFWMNNCRWHQRDE